MFGNVLFILGWKYKNYQLWKRAKEVLKGLEENERATLVFYHPETQKEIPETMPVPENIILSDVCHVTESFFGQSDVADDEGGIDWIGVNMLKINNSRDFRWLAVNARDKGAIKCAISSILAFGYGRNVGAHRSWCIALVPNCK